MKVCDLGHEHTVWSSDLRLKFKYNLGNCAQFQGMYVEPYWNFVEETIYSDTVENYKIFDNYYCGNIFFQ